MVFGGGVVAVEAQLGICLPAGDEQPHQGESQQALGPVWWSPLFPTTHPSGPL